MRSLILALTGAFLAACSASGADNPLVKLVDYALPEVTDRSVANLVANPLPEQDALSHLFDALPRADELGINFVRSNYKYGRNCRIPYSNLSLHLYDVEGEYVVHVEDIFSPQSCSSSYFGTATQTEALAHALLSVGARPRKGTYNNSGQLQ